jgi:hypothetical protein
MRLPKRAIFWVTREGKVEPIAFDRTSADVGFLAAHETDERDRWAAQLGAMLAICPHKPWGTYQMWVLDIESGGIGIAQPVHLWELSLGQSGPWFPLYNAAAMVRR